MIIGYNISTMQVRKQGAGVLGDGAVLSTPHDHPTLLRNTEVKNFLVLLHEEAFFQITTPRLQAV